MSTQKRLEVEKDCTSSPPAVIDDLSMIFIDERAEIAVVEVFAQFELFFCFFLDTHK